MTVAPSTTDRFAADLRARISGEVRSDPGHRALYAGDASNHRVVPAAVVLPRTLDDVAATIAACAAEGIPLTSRGAGTGIAGGALGSGVVVDLSRHLDQILDIDVEGRTAVVQPGVVLDDLQKRAAPHRLRFGPDPSSHNRCTIGGMVGTNACGSHSVAWGTTARSVRSLRVALADGRVVRLGPDGTEPVLRDGLAGLAERHQAEIGAELGRFRRQVSGYGLQHLLPGDAFNPAKAFVGTEGTCGLVTEAEVDLVPLPAHRLLVVAGFADLVAAAAAAPVLAREGTLTVEAMGQDVVTTFDARRGSQSRPERTGGRAWLLVEVGTDDPGTAAERARAVSAQAADAGAVDTSVVTDPRHQAAMWAIREKGAGLASRTVDGREAWAGWEDAAVPPEHLSDYLAAFQDLLTAHDRRGVIYGHFGEGCVHVRIDHDMLSPAGRAAYRRFQQEAAGLVVAHGGSLSGEHGDGRTRSELLAGMYSPRMMQAFAEFKGLFDPDDVFNPGVIVDPVPFDADLRGAISRPHTRDTPGTRHLAFAYGDDDGDFAKADVPVVPGHARRAAQHPRPRPPAVRDARRRAQPAGLAVRRGQRRARPLPGLQGVQQRVPGRGRHGHLQGGVPAPARSAAAATAAALQHGLAAGMAALRAARAAAGERHAAAQAGPVGRRHRRTPEPSAGGVRRERRAAEPRRLRRPSDR